MVMNADKKRQIDKAQALYTAYGIALESDLDIGYLNLHEEIYELLCYFLDVNDLTFDDLDN
jgi:hypothetical protein